MPELCRESKSTTAALSAHLSGIAVSPGVGLGQSLWLGRLVFPSERQHLEDAEVATHVEAFDDARRHVLADLQQEIASITLKLGPYEAAILDTHVSMLNDHGLIANVRRQIVDLRRPVAEALAEVMTEYEQAISATSSDYLNARIEDIRDVLGRVAQLADSEQAEGFGMGAGLDADVPIVLLADELMLSHLTSLRAKNVVAIATSGGGRTSHAAILAAALGMPAVVGAGHELGTVANGTRVVVDGRSGSVIINPSLETTRKYRQEIREIGQLTTRLARSPQGETQTADGTTVQLLANISSAADAELANHVGADGIGLLRTEFYYIARRSLPGEDAEVRNLLQAVRASPPGPFVIRTLDIGGDKAIPYLTYAVEPNPFLGWRSIRMSFEHPEMFVQQLRAILQVAAKSSATHEVKLLFPFVTAKSEWCRIRRFVDIAFEQAVEQGCPVPQSIPMGIMIEVPASAICIDHFLPEVDFVAIGTNDLVQYVTAADRDNPRVSHLCHTLSPAMIRLLRDTIRKCNEAGVPVSVCGEMAGSVRAFLPLLGMGLRAFSMSPSFIPAIRDLARHVTISEATAVLEDVMRLDKTEAIQNVLDEHLVHLRAELASLLLG